MKLIVNILSGGKGSRLWPLSRENYPKPFIKILDNESLLKKTIKRVLDLPSLEEIITITQKDLIFIHEDEYKGVDFKGIKKTFILEPDQKNTAPSIFLSALEINKKYGMDAIVIVMPADHYIEETEKFHDSIIEGIKFAERNEFVTFGITPSSPSSAYGYIEADGNKVINFFEKPKLELAIKYFEEGSFYWNSGIFCFKVGTLIEYFKSFIPDIADPAKKCFELSAYYTDHSIRSDLPDLILDEKSFNKIPCDSIDYALLEKIPNISVIPCTFAWADVGSWIALTNLMKADKNNNRGNENVKFYNSSNTSVYSSGPSLVLIGVDNLVVSQTDDTILIMNKKEDDDLKNTFQKILSVKDLCIAHKKFYRPWGSYSILAEEETFKVKRIIINSKRGISLQKHKYRSEHWVVIKGTATVIIGDKKKVLTQNESIFIPQGQVHQLVNFKNEELEIIETQVGSVVSEDDIERFTSNYEMVE